MTDPLAEMMKKLGRDYLRESPARVAELRAALSAVEQGEAGAMDTLRRQLHKLAGSGGSYGFDDVSTSARAGETVARRLFESGAAPGVADLAALRAAIDAVAAAFDAACATEDLGTN